MKAFSKSNKNTAMLVAALSLMMLAMSLPAFAVPPLQVARTVNVQTITAKCCVPMNPTVTVTEPATVTPVIVTWGADYNTSGTAQFGLIVNGGPCVAYGPFVVQQPVLIPGSNSLTVSGSHQWIVFPTDGLVRGRNTFQVCGGGFGESQTINIGFSSLAVQLSK